MKYALWIVQVLLALAFLASGAMKLLTPMDQLAANMAWVNAVPELLVPGTWAKATTSTRISSVHPKHKGKTYLTNRE